MPDPSALGPYAVVRRLGAGGMGTVYLCEHRSLGRLDAVKVPHAGLLSDREALRRFQREAQVAARLDQPNGGSGRSGRAAGAAAGRGAGRGGGVCGARRAGRPGGSVPDQAD